MRGRGGVGTIGLEFQKKKGGCRAAEVPSSFVLTGLNNLRTPVLKWERSLGGEA